MAEYGLYQVSVDGQRVEDAFFVLDAAGTPVYVGEDVLLVDGNGDRVEITRDGADVVLTSGERFPNDVAKDTGEAGEFWNFAAGYTAEEAAAVDGAVEWGVYTRPVSAEVEALITEYGVSVAELEAISEEPAVEEAIEETSGAEETEEEVDAVQAAQTDRVPYVFNYGEPAISTGDVAAVKVVNPIGDNGNGEMVPTVLNQDDQSVNIAYVATSSQGKWMSAYHEIAEQYRYGDTTQGDGLHLDIDRTWESEFLYFWEPEVQKALDNEIRRFAGDFEGMDWGTLNTNVAEMLADRDAAVSFLNSDFFENYIESPEFVRDYGVSLLPDRDLTSAELENYVLPVWVVEAALNGDFQEPLPVGHELSLSYQGDSQQFLAGDREYLMAALGLTSEEINSGDFAKLDAYLQGIVAEHPIDVDALVAKAEAGEIEVESPEGQMINNALYVSLAENFLRQVDIAREVSGNPDFAVMAQSSLLDVPSASLRAEILETVDTFVIDGHVSNLMAEPPLPLLSDYQLAQIETVRAAGGDVVVIPYIDSGDEEVGRLQQEWMNENSAEFVNAATDQGAVATATYIDQRPTEVEFAGDLDGNPLYGPAIAASRSEANRELFSYAPVNIQPEALRASVDPVDGVQLIPENGFVGVQADLPKILTDVRDIAI